MSNSTQVDPVAADPAVERRRIEGRLERLDAAHHALSRACRWLYRDLGVLATREPAFPARRSAEYTRVRDLCRALKTLDNKVLALQVRLNADLSEIAADSLDAA